MHEGPSPLEDSYDPAARAKQALASRHLSLRALARALDGGVVLVGADGELDFMSEGTIDLFGRVRPFEEIWAWLGPRLHRLVDRASLLRDGELNTEITMPEELGARVLAARVFPVEDDDCMGYIAILKDRRSIDALHADLRSAAQMRRLALLFEQGAHDLKAPLNALGITVDVVRKRLEDLGVGDVVHAQIDVLRSEILRLKRMIQMLMSHASGQSSAARRFELRRLARECVTLVRPQAKRARVTVRTALGRAPIQIVGVRDHLKQAVVNLLVNAVEAMPEGGTLSVDLACAGDRAEMAITDTGVGIPARELARVFKLHVTTKSTGTGIGLFSARATLRAMGGDLRLESVEGQGTVARLEIPLAGDEGAEADPWSIP